MSKVDGNILINWDLSLFSKQSNWAVKGAIRHSRQAFIRYKYLKSTHPFSIKKNSIQVRGPHIFSKAILIVEGFFCIRGFIHRIMSIKYERRVMQDTVVPRILSQTQYPEIKSPDFEAVRISSVRYLNHYYRMLWYPDFFMSGYWSCLKIQTLDRWIATFLAPKSGYPETGVLL